MNLDELAIEAVRTVAPKHWGAYMKIKLEMIIDDLKAAGIIPKFTADGIRFDIARSLEIKLASGSKRLVWHPKARLDRYDGWLIASALANMASGRVRGEKRKSIPLCNELAKLKLDLSQEHFLNNLNSPDKQAFVAAIEAITFGLQGITEKAWRNAMQASA